MRATRWVLAMVLALPGGAAADGEPDHLRRLIAGLASPDFRERETATRELDRLGEAAVAALRTAATTGDAETRLRAAELAERIGRRTATAHILAPAHVTLNYDKTPLAEAVADIARRTRTAVSLHGDPARFRGRTVTLVSNKATFWQALELFCHRAGLHEWDGLSQLPPIVEEPAGQGDAAMPADGVQVLGQLNVRRGQVNALTVSSPALRIALLDGPAAAPAHHAGAVRVRPLPPGVPFAADAGKDVLLVLGVTAEPRLWVDGATDLRIERAIDDQGRPRETRPLWADPPDDRDDWRAPRLPREVTERRCGPVALRITPADPPPKRLRELAGVVTVQAFAAERVVEVALPHDPAQRTAGRAGGVAVTVLSAGHTLGGEYRVAAEVQLPYGVRLDLPLAGPIGVGNRGNGFGRGWIGLPPADSEPTAVQGDEYQGLTLDADAGRRWPVTSGSTEVVGLFPQWFTVRVTATFRPPAAGSGPARVGYSVRRPTAVDVPFVLRDVPLP